MRGDHIYISSSVAGIPFEHHGIDMGDGTVIHLAPAEGARITLRDATDRFTVRRDTIEVFSRGRTVCTRKHTDCVAADLVAENAEKMLGKTGYHLLDGNCEHFAHHCCTGRLESRQIDMGESVVVSAASLLTKAFWSVSARIGARAASTATVKVASKANPLLLLADGVELAALAAGCAGGLSSSSNRRVARVSGTLTAASIGAIMGGPVGTIASVAVHNGSTALAEQVCKRIRQICA